MHFPRFGADLAVRAVLKNSEILLNKPYFWGFFFHLQSIVAARGYGQYLLYLGYITFVRTKESSKKKLTMKTQLEILPKPCHEIWHNICDIYLPKCTDDLSSKSTKGVCQLFLILNQEKDDSHPLVGTQVNSLLGQIHVTQNGAPFLKILRKTRFSTILSYVFTILM